MKRLSRRGARGVVMGIWSAWLGWLWLSGDVSRYLGPRTFWVAVFGALALGLAAAAHLVVALREAALEPTERVSAREAAGLAVLLVPIAAVLVVPGAELGSLAAANKATSTVLAGPGAEAPLGRGDGGPPSFIDIHYASESSEFAALHGISEGLEVDLTGFVSVDPGRDGSFELTRFYVSCCAADAIPYSVTVDPGPAAPERFEQDEWYRVSGRLEAAEDGFVVVAEDAKRVPSPEDPYLY